MATFFPSSSDQREAAPMIYSRESLPTSYSEAPVISANMMMYMNYLSSPGSDTLAATSQQNSCHDIPPVGDSVSNHFGGSRIGEHNFQEWGNGRSEMSFMPPMGGATGLLQSMQNMQGQGLSLSLSTQLPSAMQMPSIDYRNPNSGFSAFLNPNLSIAGEGSGNSDNMKSGISPYEMSSFSRTVPNSKYLKAAQQLLDEVVTVRKALKPKESKKDQMKSSNEGDGGLKDETSDAQQESVNDSPKELPAAERQCLQDKLRKLLSLLDEVDKRYKQYYHQMQSVVSSFDVIAGCGAAKPYTALALQTISRHFRCLRDAITGQIRVLRKNLGEQDTSDNSKGVGISRLRYVDQHLRQQRALQQLGMMQQHAWRPQRGLPESSVSILRAWLFEHFLHPYPKDSDKSMLARQTGLTRSQVSNWFINARVRLWKPMVEEMYKEETGDAEMDSNSSSEGDPKATKGDMTACEDRNEDFKQSATSVPTERHGTGQYLDSISISLSLSLSEKITMPIVSPTFPGKWLGKAADFLVSATSSIVFLVLDLLDILLCVFFKIADEFFEGNAGPCYCHDRGERGSEVSETLYGRKNVLREIGSVRYTKKREALEKNGGRKNWMIVKNRWSDCGCESCVSWMSISDKRLHVVVQEPSQDAFGSDCSSKPTENVIFLHGFISSSSLWTEMVFPNLSEPTKRNYRLFAVDLLGFGRSPKPRDCLYTLRDHLEMVEKSVIDVFQLSSFHLVAHSMGCIVAVALAAKYSKSVKSITLLAPPYFPSPKDGASLTALRRLADRKLWPPLLFGSAVMTWYEHLGRCVCFLFCRNHRAWEWILKLLTRRRDLHFLFIDMTRHTHHSAWHTMHNVICGGAKSMDECLEALRDSKAKIHVIQGARDHVVPVECSSNIKMKVPQTEVEIIANADHNSVILNREREFTRNLERIWESTA